MSKVTVYGYECCRYCTVAKALLELHGVPYTYRDVKADLSARADFLALADPAPVTVPQVVIGGVLIGGADALNEHFSDPTNVDNAR